MSATIKFRLTHSICGILCRNKRSICSAVCNKYQHLRISGQSLDKLSPLGTHFTKTMSTLGTVCVSTKSAGSNFSKTREDSIDNENSAAALSSTLNNGDGELKEDTNDFKSKRLIWIDLEMTGLDFVNDRILEISCLVTEGDLHIVAEGPHIIVHESDEVLSNMGDWCQQHHGKSGLTQAVRRSKVSLGEAEQMLLHFVRQHTAKGTCPLAGNTVGMDKSFIERHMPEFAQHLHHRIVDVSTVKELCRRWFPEQFSQAPVKQDNHRARDDILESIAELTYYRSTIFK